MAPRLSEYATKTGDKHYNVENMDAGIERDLVARAREDKEAFGVLYEAHYSLVFHYCLRRLGSVKLAEDVTSDTFFNALKNIWRYQWQNIAFSAWLYRIAGNEINRYFRRGTHRPVTLESLRDNGFDPPAQDDVAAELVEVEAVLSRHADFLEVQKRLKTIPVKYQEVIALRFFEGKKVSEIAKILGKREGTVKSLLSRGLDKLRENWDHNPNVAAVQPFSFRRIVESRGQ
jgi:RNA polymerase sigma-70 factor, ECF subfamily